ncbi:hypothetical protein [Erythrobacter sp. BLCC-B19]|uniref:hypothetical protein n=1 Tax=Erythrobacter sp. BLCC-B19 TaxID=3025315 RepID=UPI00235F6B41|nr:hypothetical protein [Erythrobacter sp. BLCC-B19]WDA40383.1 hypothetical protein PS060_12540 [Erythrobacter sp. BLCC-B19]
MIRKVNWNYASQLMTLCVAVPFLLVVLWFDWLSDGWFIAALIAAGIVSLPLSWTITARMQRKWNRK